MRLSKKTILSGAALAVVLAVLAGLYLTGYLGNKSESGKTTEAPSAEKGRAEGDFRHDSRS